MNNTNIVIIGHFSLDKIIRHKIPNQTTEFQALGGSATYCSLALSKYDPKEKLVVVSKIGREFPAGLFSIFDKSSVDLSHIQKTKTLSTSYCLEYFDGQRKLRLVSKAPPISIKDFTPDILGAKVFHFAPIANETPVSLIRDIFSQSTFPNAIFGLDIQGLIRKYDSENHVILEVSIKERKEIFDMCRLLGDRLFLKASDEEAKILAGCKDLEEATIKLSSLGIHVISTLGRMGLYFKSPYLDLIKLNAYKPLNIMDETGAGDAFMAVFLKEISDLIHDQINIHQNCDINEVSKGLIKTNYLNALQKGSAAASFIVEKKGPHGFCSKREIQNRITKDL
ncbi:MAG: PfkB family carbohydrate kinase, partial [Promethearchaeota archaeon]